MSTATISPLRAWLDATQAIKSAFIAERTEHHMEAIAADRKKRGVKQGMTNTQTAKARNLAKGDWVRKSYQMEQHDGVRNPVHDDAEWSPNATPAAAPKSSKPNKYGGKCPNCDGWVEAEAGNLIKVAGKWGAEHTTCPENKPEVVEAAPENKPELVGLDLSGLVPGYYAVPDGDTRLKLAISQGTGAKWAGWTFVKDAAEYGQQKRYGMQRPGQRYNGDVQDALRTILADPKAAMAAYGKLTGTCGACGAHLENETSIAAGIGPICAGKF